MESPYASFPEALRHPMFITSSEMDFSIEGTIDTKPRHLSSPVTMDGHWNIQRYLTDASKSSFFGCPTVDTALTGPLPSMPNLLRRRDSPSCSHPSSDSDYCAVQSPTTPTDSGPRSPPLFHYYEGYDHQGQLYQLTGVAIGGCVKPGDVNPFQDSPVGYYDDTNSGANLVPRTYSLCSDDGNTHIEQLGVADHFQTARRFTPGSLTPVVKEEIEIPETGERYPSIDPNDDVASNEEVETPYLKGEEDEDYKPQKKSKRTSPSSNRQVRSRKRLSNAQSSSDTKRIKPEREDSPTTAPKSKSALHVAKGSFCCSECPRVSFQDQSGLETHIKKQHTRPFTCVFEFAGCDSTFASKNEWKRHTTSQHLVLNYWVCEQNQCAKIPNNSNALSKSHRNRASLSRCPTSSSPDLPNGTIFNRKDLYTQHLRRMHVPASVKKQVKQKKSVPDWDDRERAHQEAALRTRCQLPTLMLCPATKCGVQFDGPTAWDDRMEHVAKHLEKAAAGTEQPLEFGGDHDPTLTRWASDPTVAIIRQGEGGKWELRNPLKPEGGPRGHVFGPDEDEDAEGEEIDDC